MKDNPYQPWLATIDDIREEVGGVRPIKTFRLKFQDKNIQNNFAYLPGQCTMISLLGQNVSLQFLHPLQRKITLK